MKSFTFCLIAILQVANIVECSALVHGGLMLWLCGRHGSAWSHGKGWRSVTQASRALTLPLPEAVQAGHGAATGERRQRHQRGGAEELVPSDDDVGEVQVVQHDLRQAHEHLTALHAPVVAPHRHLLREGHCQEAFRLRDSLRLLAKGSCCWTTHVFTHMWYLVPFNGNNERQSSSPY